ncbi:MAG: response regulator [Rhodobacterales bacterium]|nr:MAG: response regulator [Rhodobacterales bacterium]
MDDFESFMMLRTPTAERPLLGMTVLLVEDSRFTSEAMRLLCLRSGARIRRADCLASARRHLQVYRPCVVVVDMGLPDGTGADLIAELHRARPRINVVLGISGDSSREAEALQAGADGFLAKPVESLALFQQAILAHLPDDAKPSGPRVVHDDRISPDLVAFHDDIAHAADVLSKRPKGKTLDYVAHFTRGIAKSAHDNRLEAAAKALARDRAAGASVKQDVQLLRGMFEDRLQEREIV